MIQRKLDLNTITYSFNDGSGLVTKEQCLNRELLRSKIEEESLKTTLSSRWSKKIELSSMIINYLTFFTK